MQLFQHWCDVVVFTGACYKVGFIVLDTLQPSCLCNEMLCNSELQYSSPEVASVLNALFAASVVR